MSLKCRTVRQWSPPTFNDSRPWKEHGWIRGYGAMKDALVQPMNGWILRGDYWHPKLRLGGLPRNTGVL